MNTKYYYLTGCTKCGGLLIFDEGDWRCWQCGQYRYMTRDSSDEVSQSNSIEGEAPPSPQGSGQPHHPTPMTPGEFPRRVRPRGYALRGTRNIDAIIRAKQVSDERWWARNSQTITYLDQGLSVQRIAKLVGQNDRQIRAVREKLGDLRAEAQEA